VRVLICLHRVRIAHYCAQTKRDSAYNNAPPYCDRAIGEKGLTRPGGDGALTGRRDLAA
jgi:hypothetical protein